MCGKRTSAPYFSGEENHRGHSGHVASWRNPPADNRPCRREPRNFRCWLAGGRRRSMAGTICQLAQSIALANTLFVMSKSKVENDHPCGVAFFGTIYKSVVRIAMKFSDEAGSPTSHGSGCIIGHIQT